jgi:hypothetical protein
LPPDTTYCQVLDQLARACQEFLDSHVIDQVLQPLARTIATK